MIEVMLCGVSSRPAVRSVPARVVRVVRDPLPFDKNREVIDHASPACAEFFPRVVMDAPYDGQRCARCGCCFGSHE